MEIKLTPEIEALLIEAYTVGSGRGTYLMLGYSISPDCKTVYCSNPSSAGGVYVGDIEGYSGECLEGFLHFDMSAALAVIETPVLDKQCVEELTTFAAERPYLAE